MKDHFLSCPFRFPVFLSFCSLAQLKSCSFYDAKLLLSCRSAAKMATRATTDMRSRRTLPGRVVRRKLCSPDLTSDILLRLTAALVPLR